MGDDGEDDEDDDDDIRDVIQNGNVNWYLLTHKILKNSTTLQPLSHIKAYD